MHCIGGNLFLLQLYATAGSVILSHGEQSRTVLINVPPEYVGEESFALHLTAVYSNVTGKAKLR